MPPKPNVKRADAAEMAKREAQEQIADFSDSAVTAHAQMRDVQAALAVLRDERESRAQRILKAASRGGADDTCVDRALAVNLAMYGACRGREEAMREQLAALRWQLDTNERECENVVLELAPAE